MNRMGLQVNYMNQKNIEAFFLDLTWIEIILSHKSIIFIKKINGIF